MEESFNIFIINIIIYNYYLRNYKKENIIFFYAIYKSIFKAADNFLKDYIKIIKIITIYNNFINKVIILNKITNRLPTEYYKFKDIFNYIKADKLLLYRTYNYKIKLTSKGVPLRNYLYPIFKYKL